MGQRPCSACSEFQAARSPAREAVKIRCRSRRTLSSQARQSTASQSRIASSGPFATTVVVASNLSFRFRGLWSSSSPQAHLTASARFRARAPGPVSGRLRGTAGGGGQPSCPGFPLPYLSGGWVSSTAQGVLV